MIKNYDQIFSDLFKSESRGNVICVKVKGNDKPLLTSVKEVKSNRIIVFNPVSVYGALLEENVYHIEDIETLKVYSALYSDPVYVRIRELKHNIDEIKRSMRW